MHLNSERQELFDHLASSVGNTPLYEIRNIPIPNGNHIFCKEEYRNPTGTHYDRFWVEYMRYLEEEGKIYPGMDRILLESSTGNSGSAFAWVCKVLGYTDPQPEIVIPEDMPKARIAQIEDFGAKVILSSKGEYVKGLVKKFQDTFFENRKKYFIPNHCCDTVISQKVMKKLVEEVHEQMAGKEIDCFVSALGNGLTTRGIGSALRETKPDTRIIGVEAKENPTIFPLKYGYMPQETASHTHELLGTAPGNLGFFHFKNIESFVDEIDEVVLVDNDEWRSTDQLLRETEGKFVGHTSAACLKVALDYAEKVSNQNIFIIFYDPA